MAAPKRSGLGRGLDALFADAVPVSDSADEKQEKPAAAADAVQYINIHDIMPNANQPRKTFSEEKIIPSVLFIDMWSLCRHFRDTFCKYSLFLE